MTFIWFTLVFLFGFHLALFAWLAVRVVYGFMWAMTAYYTVVTATLIALLKISA